ncbi:hypothetical protein ABIA32_006315 [Streptacidiphilus sp. MAP12-20]
MSNIARLPKRVPGETPRVIPTTSVRNPNGSPTVHRTDLVAAGLSLESALALIARVRRNEEEADEPASKDGGGLVIYPPSLRSSPQP